MNFLRTISKAKSQECTSYKTTTHWLACDALIYGKQWSKSKRRGKVKLLLRELQSILLKSRPSSTSLRSSTNNSPEKTMNYGDFPWMDSRLPKMSSSSQMKEKSSVSISQTRLNKSECYQRSIRGSSSSQLGWALQMRMRWAQVLNQLTELPRFVNRKQISEAVLQLHSLTFSTWSQATHICYKKETSCYRCG